MISSPDGESAAELQANPEAVQVLSEGFRRLVGKVHDKVKRRGPHAGHPQHGGGEGGGPGSSGGGGIGPNGTRPDGPHGQGNGNGNGGRPENPGNGGGPNGTKPEGAGNGNQGHESHGGEENGSPNGTKPEKPSGQGVGTDGSSGNVGGSSNHTNPETPAGGPGTVAQSASQTSPSNRRRFLRHSNLWGRATRLLYEETQSRFLTVEVDESSADLYNFLDSPCTTDAGTSLAVSRQNNQKCITVFGKFQVIVSGADTPEVVYQTYEQATKDSIANGTLEESIVEVDPNTTLSVKGPSTLVDTHFDPFAGTTAPVDSGATATPSDLFNTPAPDLATTTTAPVPTPAATTLSNETAAPTAGSSCSLFIPRSMWGLSSVVSMVLSSLILFQ